jgi:hypothetical protein
MQTESKAISALSLGNLNHVENFFVGFNQSVRGFTLKNV